MRIDKRVLCALACALGMSTIIQPLSDNPYFPIFGRNIYWMVEEDSNFGAEIWAISGHQAWDQSSREITIPMLSGALDLHQLSEAAHILDLPDPLPTAWQGFGTIPIFTVGKLQGQGITFQWHQKIYEDIVSCGFQWYFMVLDNTQRFSVANGSERENIGSVNLYLGPGDRDKLDEVRREYFEEFGIKGTTFQQGGCGDLDAYLQLGKRFDHELKVRELKVGARLGVVAPTSPTRNQNISGSIPFGGDGFWGGYVSVHAVAEIKEDFKLGCLLQISKRFGATKELRVSVAGEPAIFGAALAPIHVNPGMMVLIAPFFLIDNIREGFGLGMTYTVSKHRRDLLEDRRPFEDQQKVPLELFEMSSKTKWSSSYVTLTAQYDFGATKAVRQLEPILSVRWDVPVEWMGTKQVVKTHKLAIGLDIVF
jgi:hypothetical protein